MPGVLDVSLTGTNRLTGGPDPLLPGGPNLYLDVQSFQTTIGENDELSVLVTDTGLDLIEGTARAFAFGEVNGSDTITFGYYGDEQGEAFEEGFIIGEYTKDTNDSFLRIAAGLTDPVGSATIDITIAGSTAGELVTASYITALTITPSAIPIPAAAWLFGS